MRCVLDRQLMARNASVRRDRVVAHSTSDRLCDRSEKGPVRRHEKYCVDGVGRRFGSRLSEGWRKGGLGLERCLFRRAGRHAPAL
jgi:hypothetical protein